MKKATLLLLLGLITLTFSCKKEVTPPTYELTQGIYSFSFQVNASTWQRTYTTAPNFQGVYYRYYYSKPLFPNTILTDGAVLVYNTASAGPGSGMLALPYTYVSSVTNNIPRFFTWDYFINNDYVEVSITSSSLNMTDSEIPSGSTYYRVVGITNQTLLQKNLSVDKLRDYNTAVQALGLNTQM